MTLRIVDIAKKAKVSPATVSLALNNKSGVSSQVRQNIINIAVEMGYKSIQNTSCIVNSNVTIKFLKIAKHGHVVNERHNAFITEYLQGIETGAKKCKYKLEVSFHDRMPIEDIVKNEMQSGVDGYIVLGTELNAHELNCFTNFTKPIVFIDTWFPLATFDCIDMDNDDGVFRSIQYLYTSGHRNIGLIKSKVVTRNFRMREESFRESMEYFSLPIQEQFIVPVIPTVDQAAVDMNRFLDKSACHPSAFFCMNDIVAYGCMKALREHNIKVPEDVSVIGFDDLPSSSITNPPLTTIRVSTCQIGERALERLADKINGLTLASPEKILVAGNLIIRNSVKKI